MVEYGLLDWVKGNPWPKAQFHLTMNLYDIPRTVTACIANLPPNCKRVNVVYNGAMARHKEFWYQIIFCQ